MFILYAYVAVSMAVSGGTRVLGREWAYMGQYQTLQACSAAADNLAFKYFRCIPTK